MVPSHPEVLPRGTGPLPASARGRGGGVDSSVQGDEANRRGGAEGADGGEDEGGDEHQPEEEKAEPQHDVIETV